MKSRWNASFFAGLAAVVLLWGSGFGRAADPRSSGVTQLRNSEIFVHELDVIPVDAIRDVSLIDWNSKTNRLIFSKRSLDHYYDVFSSTPEGFSLSALTLDRSRSRARLNNSAANWHPSGKYFVFSGQNRGSTDARRSGPDGGWHCNLWLARSDGSQFWKLTDIPTRYSNPQGATMPVFSHDGKKIFWTGFPEGSGQGTVYQNRALYLADFVLDKRSPAIENQQKFQPGLRKEFYESYAFSPDGDRILFSANMQVGQPWYCMDIGHFDRKESEPKILAPNPEGWDRYAAYSPDGRKIVWSSSRTFDIPFLGQGGTGWPRYLRSELWIMNEDGVGPRQLTFFNSSNAAEYTGRRTFVGDVVWSSDGNRLAMVVHRETRNFDVSSRIYMVTLGKGRPRAGSKPPPQQEEAVETVPAIPVKPRTPAETPTW